MTRPVFENGEIYHVYNRGVEKRDIFSNEKDYVRFIHDLFEFNDAAPAMNVNYYFGTPTMEVGLPYISKRQRIPRKLFVDILCYCLMPNHYHFLVKQRVENGVTEFMRKIGTGYTNYFNSKYERVGPLFQGKFKAVHVKTDRHLMYLPHYIHLNPLDLAYPEWREKRMRNARQALAFLETYRWSSYLDYVGKKNFPSVIQGKKLIYGSRTSIDYRREVTKWLRDFESVGFESVVLD